MVTCPYEVVDVFTDRPYAGNPLAVVFGADELPTERLLAVAAEFNLSETAFVLPPTGGGDYRVRIFTPRAELPFAGHPSVGTAATLVRLGRIPAGTVVQECAVGPIRVIAEKDRATLSGGPPVLGPDRDPAPLLATAGLRADDLAGLPVRAASAGFEHVFLPVSDEAVGRASVDAAAARRSGVEMVYVFSWDAGRRHAHARLFGPGVGVSEDPATGSAVLALGAWLAGAGLVPADGESAFTVAQGAEMGRPSTLEATVTCAGGEVTATTVTGGVVPVARGEIVVPASER
jgi:trans-2,3-dihydro-3-hydroxyanthranilate isomerase